MIKAAIYGDPEGPGLDLVRLLLNHPDVGSVSFTSERHAGRRLDDLAPDLAGDCDVKVTGRTDLGHTDVLFCTDGSRIPAEAVEKLRSYLDFRLVSLTAPHSSEDTSCRFDGMDTFVYGNPEINRKAMVRGARAAYCPTPIANAIELALFPLAKNLLLNSDIDVSSSLRPAGGTTAEIAEALRSVQTSFSASIRITPDINAEGGDRSIFVRVTTFCNLDESEIRRIYNEAYSDHGFTHLLPEGRTVVRGHATGTNKCLISFGRNSDGRLDICANIDSRLKGSAGNAVHCMNLLFGLDERVGLTLYSI